MRGRAAGLQATMATMLRMAPMATTLTMATMLTMAAGCATEASDAGTDAGAAAAAVEAKGCDGAKLLAPPQPPGVDDDALLRGPWPVGARTVEIAGLTVEVWYPAKPGSAQGVPRRAYDLRSWLPASEQSKIPDAEAPRLDCDCHADLPVDDAHGPYPAVVFIHGTAGFRAQSMSICTAWASHGFVVIAADHPKIVLSDALQLKLGADQVGDARKLLAALRSKDAALGPVAAVVDGARLGVSGHSAGGMATGALGDEANVQVAIPMAAEGVDPAHPVTATVVLGGIDDGVVKWSRTKEGYAATVGSKWLAGLAGAGHLAFSDLCIIGKEQGGLLGVAQTYGITLPPGTAPLFEKLATDGCKPGQMAPERGIRLSVAASLPVLRQQLHCQAGAAQAFAAVQGAADIGEASAEP